MTRYEKIACVDRVFEIERTKDKILEQVAILAKTSRPQCLFVNVTRDPAVCPARHQRVMVLPQKQTKHVVCFNAGTLLHTGAQS